MFLGVHVSISGKIYESVDRAASLGCSAMQIFSRNPRQWRQLEIDARDAVEFRKRRREEGIGIVAIHVPYLINLATSYDVLYKKSIATYMEDMREAALLGAEYVVTHMGSYKNSTLPQGLKAFIAAVNEILAGTKGLGVQLLLENTAGSGSWLGATFDHHRKIFEGVKDRHRLGVCLDTAHVFEAGFDVRRPEIFDILLAEIERKTCPGAVKVVHLNDSLTPLGSHNDRHQHIGKGLIGLRAMRHIVNHPKLREAAFILETPKETPRSDEINLSKVRKLMQMNHGL
ncbi:MAG: deoxyribonuclease IV [Candidatus Omnitrophica bacterium]|nr:deoxyribonuclease IV [Candidatus Omnitrophota bacterium]MDD5574333.1 deoxyribonuclease IV [Candidatus Omnitrophota bacterium]